jgi:hypothetical protein
LLSDNSIKHIHNEFLFGPGQQADLLDLAIEDGARAAFLKGGGTVLPYFHFTISTRS